MCDPIHTTECEVIYTHAYVHADIPNTNTRACLARIPTFTPVHSTIVHTMRQHAHSMHSCEQAIYCTHLSVWSVELWASAAPMCCAPSASMELYLRLYAHVCEKNGTAHVHSSRCAILYTQLRARSYTPMHAYTPCMYTYLHFSAQRNSA
jgi:hypothetical protein